MVKESLEAFRLTPKTIDILEQQHLIIFPQTAARNSPITRGFADQAAAKVLFCACHSRRLS